MKKLIVLFSVVGLLVAGTAFARGYGRNRMVTTVTYRTHNPAPTAPKPAPIPPTPANPTSTPIAPPSPVSSLQFGTYNDQKQTQYGTWTMEFEDLDFPSNLTGNLFIFIEPEYSDAQVLAGTIDSGLKSFATAAKSHQGNVIVALGEEENCVGNQDSWIVGRDGNTVASSIAVIQHESTVLKSVDPNILIVQSLNADDCGGNTPLTSYYAGNSYVDAIAVDGFADGNQTWSSVFEASLNALKPLGKPLWIGSEGSSGNQSQFIEDSFTGANTYGLGGIMYFSQAPYLLTSSAILTIQTLVK